MASSITLLADLKAGRCSTTAEVRLLRFWEARNTSRNSSRSGELMSVDMLLIDENEIVEVVLQESSLLDQEFLIL
ncbi:unnamed protein product [Eruca vesicaria subsp. sativa]|uniref:Uncharacterized protein n=1 Tax=Eruca vesicaria subsp. sativa TaxID=29727 RepID=A0ABC8K686_ERUVS|nr:unnamed protein product [Eruca vesicaria subsp. sativa]